MFGFKQMVSLVAVGGVLAAVPYASADTISFDPDGAGSLSAVNVAAFDFLPGNSLARQAGEADAQNTVSYTQFAQGRVGSLLDENSQSISVPGLNDDFELTITAQYQGVAGELIPGLLQLGLDANQPVNQVTLYFDDSPNANDLSGTGFDDGVAILNAFVTGASGVFQVINANGGDFDQLGNNDFPATSSVRGNGTLTLDTQVTSFDADFFKTSIIEFLINTNSLAPFTEANPSQTFDGGAVIPNLGPVNGLGEDIQLQTDATGSVVIPEPATAALLALGGMLMIRRRTEGTN